MDEDIKTAMGIIRRAGCMHVDAVRYGATVEHQPKKAKTNRVYFSADPLNRDLQFKHNWWSAIQAFSDSGMEWRTVRVRGRWLEPYRRRCAAELQFSELRRVNDVIGRVRVGILEALIDPAFETQFKTGEGRMLATRLLRALAAWDYPLIAELSEAHEAVRDGLRNVLGLTDDELIAMACVDGDEWQALGVADEEFHAFYDNRSLWPFAEQA